VKTSISEISTRDASFAEDVRAYAAAGARGIGIWEFKLGDDAAARAALRESGLAVTNCLPTVPLLLPAPGFEEPADPEARIDSIEASLRRLAAYEPDCVVCLTGPAGERDEAEARRIVVEGMRRLADVAEAAGVRLGLEPVHRTQRDDYSFLTSIPETLELLEEVGRPSVGIMFDTYHLWDTPTVYDDVAAHVGRFTGVHVADYREPPRGSSDRLLPGDGVADLPRLLGALDSAGWDGFYDIEIFSDDSLPDSLWKLESGEFARRAVASLAPIWEARDRV
jgi:sugar phosphate isomerase/epimerase